MTEVDTVIDAPVPSSRRYPKIRDLLPGKAVLISWETIGELGSDPHNAVRNSAFYWARKYGWKVRTRKDRLGIYVIRDE